VIEYFLEGFRCLGLITPEEWFAACVGVIKVAGALLVGGGIIWWLASMQRDD